MTVSTVIDLIYDPPCHDDEQAGRLRDALIAWAQGEKPAGFLFQADVSKEFRGNVRVERHNPPETKFSSSER